MLLLLLAATIIAPESNDVVYRQPHLAAYANRVVVTFGGGNNLYVAVSEDGGRSFRRPVQLPSAGVLALGMHRGPRVALTPGAIVISAIYGAEGRGRDGDLLSWRSTDGGKNWSGPEKINNVAASAREGLHGMASAGGLLFAVWLDLRSRGTRIYGAASGDGGATWSSNVQIYESPDGSVCECCHPSVAVTPAGQVYVMFRNSLEGARDMYLVRSPYGGKTFEEGRKLGVGTWMLKACPMDGGGLAFSVEGTPISVWRREKDLFLAGDTGPETKIATGRDASVAATAEGVYSAWTGAAGLEWIGPGRRAPVSLDPKGRFVQLVGSPDGAVIAAWEREGAIVVERLN